MATITKETELSASVEDVWAKLTDLEGYSDWLSIHTGYPEALRPSSPRGPRSRSP